MPPVVEELAPPVSPPDEDAMVPVVVVPEVSSPQAATRSRSAIAEGAASAKFRPDD
jgi:hypothetical protein